MADQLIPVISPEGQPGSIPLPNLDAAVKRGFRQGTYATSPEGVKGILPMDKVQDALKRGFTEVGVPRQMPPKAPEMPGATVGSVLGEAALGGASGLGLPESKSPFMDLIRGLGKPTKAEEGLNPILNAPSVSGVPAAISKLLPIGRPVGNLVEGIAGNHIEEAKRAYQDLRQGNLEHGITRATGAVAPIFGPGIAEGGIEAEQGIKAGDPNAISHGLGVAGGSIIGGLLGRQSGQRVASQAIEKVGGGVIQGAEKVGSLAKTAAGQFSPALLNAEQSATKALKPRNSINNWKDKVATALPDAKRAADNLGIKVENLDHAQQAVLQAKKDIWNEYETNFLGPNQHVQVDGSPVAENIRATVSERVAEQNPAFAKKINKIADTYKGKTLTLGEIEGRVQELNNDLAGVMARTKVSRRIAERTPTLAPKFAELNTLRGMLNDSLEKFAGPGAPELKNRYGSLVTLEDVISRRQNVADRAAPESLIEQIGRMQAAGKMVKGGLKLFPGFQVTGLWDIAEGAKNLQSARVAKQLNNADYLIGQAFGKTQATGKAKAPVVPGIMVPKLPAEQAPRSGLGLGTRGAMSRPPKGKEGGFAAMDMMGLLKHEPDVPTFYSKAQRVAQEKLPNAFSADMAKQTLANSGVKADELKWLGLDEFLANKPKVSKQELLEHMRQSSLQVKEVVKGGAGISPDMQRYFSGASIPSTPDQWLMHSREMESAAQHWQKSGQAPKADKMFALAEEANRLAEGLNSETGSTQGMPKFSNYQLPGGENYRELLLTMPKIGQEPSGIKPGQMADVPAKQFRGGHFDEPNVLAHVRFNDRVDASGKKTLFLEEIQSDWHQKGKRQGYTQRTLPEGYQVVKRGLAYEVSDSTGNSMRTPDGNVLVELSAEKAKEKALATLNAKAGGVPDAPFKSTWHELALKRMLRWAAENKYDKLAWTTGEQQAGRYDLSKQVDAIRLSGDPAQGLVIEAAPKGEGYRVMASDVKPEKLADHVGKEIAQKFAETDQREFKGVDLKVGGEGMKGFYDKMLPDFLNKYGKKWGAQVGQSEIPLSPEKKFEDFSQQHLRAWPESTPEQVRDAHQKFGKSMKEKVHSIDITPQMKRSVMKEGQPIAKINGMRIPRMEANA